MEKERSFVKRLLAVLVTATVMTVLTVFSAASPAAAVPYCSSDDVDSDGDGWGYENGRSCLVHCEAADFDAEGDGWGYDHNMRDSCRVDWKTCNLPPSTTHARGDWLARADTIDPLHWHFGRVANLSARPFGKIKTASGLLPDFDNFTADVGETEEFYDGAGVAWVLQSPPESRFHQPGDLTGQWARILTNPLFTRPVEPEHYPMRKFMTRPDARGRAFELVLRPDDPDVQPFTYDEQKVLTGPLGGTYNYGVSRARHTTLDIVPHTTGLWTNAFGINRPGGDYDRLRSEADVIRPQYRESPASFRIRSSQIADNLDDVRQAARGTRLSTRSRTPSHNLQWADNIRDQTRQYLLVPNGSRGDAVMVRPELNHVIEAYLGYKGTLVTCQNAS